MAKGYPDYFGQSIWPKYGAPIYNTTPVYELGMLETKNILSISGNGVLYSLHSGVYADSTIVLVVVELFVDGQMIFDSSLPPTYIPAEHGSGGPVLGLSVWDKLLNYSMWDLVREVPFRESVVYTVTGNAVPKTYAYAESVHYVVV